MLIMLVWELYFENPRGQINSKQVWAHNLTSHHVWEENQLSRDLESKELDILESLGTEYKINMKY